MNLCEKRKNQFQLKKEKNMFFATYCWHIYEETQNHKHTTTHMFYTLDTWNGTIEVKTKITVFLF